jgi:hypothetical protein
MDRGNIYAALAGTLSCMMIAGCRPGEIVSPASAARSNLVRASTSSLQVTPRTIDDEFSDIATVVPGFGGAFVVNGEVHAYLVDTLRGKELRSVLASSRVLALAHHSGSQIKIHKGQFDFRDLVKWELQAQNLLASVPGVVWFDANEATNQVEVGVANAESMSDVESGIRLLGIPQAAIRVEMTQMPLVHTDFLSTNGLRPFGAGMNVSLHGTNIDGWISWGGGCTAGPTVWIPSGAVPNGISETYMITNSHCTPVFWSEDFVDLYQSSNTAPYKVGTESVDPAPFYGGACPSGKACRWSETALVDMFDANGVEDTLNTTAYRGWIARTTFSDPNQGSLQIDAAPNNAFVVQGARDATIPLMGDEADLMGSVSGWTTGTVIHACMNTTISGINSHIHFTGQPYLLCQDMTSATSRPGDSGQPVFFRHGTTDSNGREWVRLLGVAWGGGTGASPTWFSVTSNIIGEYPFLSSYGNWGY